MINTVTERGIVNTEGENLSTAWLQTILAVADQPGRAAFHTVTRITDAGRDEHPRIRAAADRLLADVDLSGVATVANTIFPDAIARRSPDVNALAARYQDLYSGTLRRLHSANRRGTYFLRLIAYPGPSGTVNQLGNLITNLRTELATRGPKTARYEVGVDSVHDTDPGDAADRTARAETSAPVFVPGQDTGAMGFPCLSFLSFQLDHGQLHAVAHYRSQYLIERGYGNYLGLCQLVRYVADETALTPGSLMVVTGKARVDAIPVFRITALRQLASDLDLV